MFVNHAGTKDLSNNLSLLDPKLFHYTYYAVYVEITFINNLPWIKLSLSMKRDILLVSN